MSKDYANKRRRHPSRHRSSTRSSVSLPSWAWLLLGALIGAGCAAIVYWKTTSHRPPLPNQVMMTVKTPQGKTLSKTLAKSTLSQTGEKRFDFYNLLPNLAQETSDLSPPPQQAKVEVEKLTPPAEAVIYTIQAGSFRLLSQAEELKAKLVINGFEASIQTHVINQGESRYRVYVGPFQDKLEALASQRKLEEAHALHSLLVKNRV